MSKTIYSNFLKGNGVVKKIDDTTYQITLSELQYFLEYQNWNYKNPDALIHVDLVLFNEWLIEYNKARYPDPSSQLQPYIPTTIVTYHIGQERLNFIAQTVLIDSQLTFTLSTKKIVFLNKNNPKVTKISTDFIEGTFKDIRLDIDPLYDDTRDYNGDFEYFLQGDIEVKKCKNMYNIQLDNKDRIVAYRQWNPFDANRNQIVEVYTETLCYFIKMLCRTFTKKVPRWNPTTLLEFLTPEGLTFTGVLIIDKMTRSKDKKKINFCFSNEKIRFFNGKDFYKSVTDILKPGKFKQVRFDIDGAGCGSANGCACYYQFFRICCLNECEYQPSNECGGVGNGYFAC